MVLLKTGAMFYNAAAFWPYQFLKLSLFVGRNAPHSFETKNNNKRHQQTQLGET
ncbi:hypothetical protein [Pseudophaeobacter sp. EL27]|uniref:hypothetical protein n=1 Tax=Pseudophaeobacter sp. EL27 TaxID=2107580 RepID=UPI0013C4C7FE|nr:hypothetical protein [Pseudophaeobacter sp. EL27]